VAAISLASLVAPLLFVCRSPIGFARRANYTTSLFRRHTALINRAFEDVSTEELQQLELILRKVGKRAESLAEKNGSSERE